MVTKINLDLVVEKLKHSDCLGTKFQSPNNAMRCLSVPNA